MVVRLKPNLTGLVLLICMVIGPVGLAQPTRITYDTMRHELYILEKQPATPNTILAQYYLSKYKYEGNDELYRIGRWDLGAEHRIAEYQDIVWDPFYLRILAVDSLNRQIMSIDPNSGKQRLVSNDFKGDGPHFEKPSRLAIDFIAKRLLVVDQQNLRDTKQRLVTLVDLQSGDRSIITGDETVLHRSNYIHDIVFDSLYNRAYLSVGRGILSIDLYDGTQFYLTQNDSPPFLQSGDLALNATTLWVADPLTQNIVSVDTATGYKRVFSAKRLTNHQTFCAPQSPLVVDQNILVVDTKFNGILKVDAVTGKRAPLAIPGTLPVTCDEKDSSGSASVHSFNALGTDQSLNAMYPPNSSNQLTASPRVKFASIFDIPTLYERVELALLALPISLFLLSGFAVVAIILNFFIVLGVDYFNNGVSVEDKRKALFTILAIPFVYVFGVINIGFHSIAILILLLAELI